MVENATTNMEGNTMRSLNQVDADTKERRYAAYLRGEEEDTANSIRIRTHVGRDERFHPRWELIQAALGGILRAAYYEHPSQDCHDFFAAVHDAKAALDMLARIPTERQVE